MASTVDELNAHIAQGHAMLVFQRLDHALHTSEEEEKGQESHRHLIKRIGMEAREFLGLKRALKVDENALAILLSPTGKVLSFSTNVAEVEKDAERFETCVALAVVENSLEDTPIRRTADEWIKVCAENNGSAFTVLKGTVDRAASSSRDRAPQSVSVRKAPSVEAPVLPQGEPHQPVRVVEETKVERRRTNGVSTKVAVRFTNGAPRRILDVADTSKTQLRDIASQLDGEVESFSTDYPRKEYSLAEYGSRTLDDLELNVNPSFLAKVNGSFSVAQVPGEGIGQAAHRYFIVLYTFILSLLASIIGAIKSIFKPNTVNPPMRQGALRGATAPGGQRPSREDRKPNQYWNGDSTVFESPDDPSNGNS